MISYLDLVHNLSVNPRDIVTIPLTNRTGKWFYAYADKRQILVTVAKEHSPKCSISVPRVLFEKEFKEIYELYLLRKQGHSVSQKAAEVTRNQVYWYGIFNDINN